jgi:hypothetical protein
VASSLEVATRDNLQGITNVDDKSAGLVGYVVPLLVAAPDLETRDRDREQKCSQTEVSVAVHSKTLGCLLGLLLDGTEECMAEVAFTRWATVGLHVVPEVVIGQLKDAGEKNEETTVDRFSQIVGKFFDLVHEGVETCRHAVDILPVSLVPVELLDTVFGSGGALRNTENK